MDLIAEEGVAAHFKYKNEIMDPDFMLDKQIARIRTAVREDFGLEYNGNFIDDFSLNFSTQDIFVKTPKGNLISLPEGSTPVDFAFEIHTGIGMKCEMAKVNGKLVPLDYKLNSNDVVQIVTLPHSKPNVKWLDFVKTSRAKVAIRRFLGKEQNEPFFQAGLVMLKAYMRKKSSIVINNGKDWRQIFNSIRVEVEYKSGIIDIGREKLTPLEFLQKEKFNCFTEVSDDTESDIEKTINDTDSNSEIPIVVDHNLKNIEYKHANCCNPVLGEDIVGYVRTGGGLTIHRKDCPNLIALIEKSPERLISVEWPKESYGENKVSISILAYDRVGLSRDINEAVNQSNTKLTYSQFSIDDNTEEIARGYIEVRIRDKNHLNKLISALKAVDGVKEIRRVNNKEAKSAKFS
jgi:guanosine-3',5'-bis(diphosphate) 3'-pyrophosphohydrolase